MTSTASAADLLSSKGIPARSAPRPMTRPGTPHQQLDQNAPPDLQEDLWSRMVALPHVRPGRSGMALPDSRALHLDPAFAHGPSAAFAPDGGTEFAHLHGISDGSLHITLPENLAAAAISAGWAEFHPVVLAGWAPPTTVMIYGPREATEVGVVFRFLQLSHAFASGPSL